MSAVDITLIATSCISGISAIVAAVLGAWVARQVKTPSGDTIGSVVEQTHDHTSALTLAMIQNGGRIVKPVHEDEDEAA